MHLFKLSVWRKESELIVCCNLLKILGLLLWHNITLSTNLLNYQISDEISGLLSIFVNFPVITFDSAGTALSAGPTL